MDWENRLSSWDCFSSLAVHQLHFQCMPKLISDQLVLRNRVPQALSGSLPSQSSTRHKTNFWWQRDIRLNREDHCTPFLSSLLISSRCASEVHAIVPAGLLYGDMSNIGVHPSQHVCCWTMQYLWRKSYWCWYRRSVGWMLIDIPV